MTAEPEAPMQPTQVQDHLELMCQVAMAEWLARRTPNHKIVGLSPAKTGWLIKTVPRGLRVATMVPRFTQP